jgi:hypothetical protein
VLGEVHARRQHQLRRAHTAPQERHVGHAVVVAWASIHQPPGLLLVPAGHRLYVEREPLLWGEPIVELADTSSLLLGMAMQTTLSVRLIAFVLYYEIL